MSLAYFDCFSGAAGDMIVAALVDAGADLEALRAQLGKLDLGDYQISTEQVRRGGIGGLKFNVDLPSGGGNEGEAAPGRHLSDILSLIEGAPLADRAAERAAAIFKRLAWAEASVHRTKIDDVHFHEVGAVDSIVDVVGACLALEQLNVDRVICSPISVGCGTVTCAHGVLPVPAPATMELLGGARTVHTGIEAELTTPTGAAILTTLAESFETPPPMALAAVGYGAGRRDAEGLPNLLRVLIGEADADSTADCLVELSANIDDCTGEIIGAAIEMLLSAGCVDAWAAPIVMKKSRPAWTLSALCAEGDASEAERIFFSETTTFGVRRRRCVRGKLSRTSETVETEYGPIRLKVGRHGGKVVSASPEFADCRSAAETHHVPVKEVFAAAQACFRRADRP